MIVVSKRLAKLDLLVLAGLVCIILVCGLITAWKSPREEREYNAGDNIDYRKGTKRF
jgi:hypothetical protein